MSRLSPLTAGAFDLVVAGGGIIGAGIARDAALNGMRVALVEQHDFGGGTTSGSTRLIHGGLRYLEMYDFGLVRLDLREREILLRIAPHLVRPLPFVLPFYDERRWQRWRLRAGMWLYDLLSYDKSLPRHQVLSAAALHAYEPALETRGLVGGAVYYDAQAAMPERLCIENVIDACAHGASVASYARVTGAITGHDRVAGLRVADALGVDPPVEVRGRMVVNATGAWLDRVSPGLEGRAAARVRTTKGVHLACPPTVTRALAVPSAVDGRLVFVIPWLGYTWVGTTDTDYEGDPADVSADGEDVDYLLRSVERYVPGIRGEVVHFTNAGVRALVRQEGHESAVSRSHQVVDHARDGLEGLVSIVGGKLTGYRAIAEEATDIVCRKLGVSRQARTAGTPLPGAQTWTGPVAAPADGALDAHLARIYGTRAAAVRALAAADSELATPLAPVYPDIAAQAVLAAREEHCVRLADFVCRRTTLAFTPDQGRQAVVPAAAWLGRTLGWSPARQDAEIAACIAVLDRAQGWRRPATSDE